MLSDLALIVRQFESMATSHVRLFPIKLPKPERRRTTILFAAPEVEMYMIGEIFKEHFYQMADINFQYYSSVKCLKLHSNCPSIFDIYQIVSLQQ